MMLSQLAPQNGKKWSGSTGPDLLECSSGDLTIAGAQGSQVARDLLFTLRLLLTAETRAYGKEFL
jgi:hypothetical protein